MAFCTNCGASLPDGTAFCTRCGAKLASSPAPRPAAPTYAAPAGYPSPMGYPAPAPAPKKKHTGLIIGIIAAVLVAAAVLVLFLTGVLGTPKEVGTWTLVSSSDDDYEPGALVASLYKDGKGYVKYTYTYTWRDESTTYTYYLPVSWTDTFLLIDGEGATYTRDGDTMTVMYDGATLIFNRTGGVEKRTPAKAGTYSAISAKAGDEDMTSELTSWTITLSDGGYGTSNLRGETTALTWDDYFITAEKSPVFYTFDGTVLTLLNGGTTITFTRVG